MYGEEFKELIGRVVKSVHITEGSLTFELEDAGFYEYELDADCCSHSYFHALSNVNKIIGKKILAFESIKLDAVEKNENDYDCVEVYGFRISAAPSMSKLRGEDSMVEVSNSMIVEFRNSSNGYYGGNLDDGRTVDKPEGELVTKNWTAGTK